MKIDQEYLKGLLDAAQTSPAPTFNIEDLKAAGFDYAEPAFEFHMRILNDQGLIEQDDGDSGIGLAKSMDGFLSWSVLPLRLTSEGHEFIAALDNVDVWTTIKREFKDASISTLKNVSLQLLEGYAKKKVEALLAP